MRILHLRQSRKMYGPEKTILGFCRALANTGHYCEIALIYRGFAGDSDHHPLVDLAGAQGTPYEEIDGAPSHLPTLIAHLRRRLRDEAFDVLHTHDYKADLMGLLATRGLHPRPALVSTPRHSESESLLAALQWVDRQFPHHFDRITESSEASVDKLRESPKLREKVRLVGTAATPASSGRPSLCRIGPPDRWSAWWAGFSR